VEFLDIIKMVQQHIFRTDGSFTTERNALADLSY
jgi:hypothetical protein